MIVTTMNDIPGYEVTDVFGEVMGLTVRSRNIGSQIGAGLKSILGGELKGMTKALVDSRQQVTERMVEEAEAEHRDEDLAQHQVQARHRDLAVEDHEQAQRAGLVAEPLHDGHAFRATRIDHDRAARVA